VGRLGGVVPKEAAYSAVRFKNGVRGVFVPEEKAEFGRLKLDECFLDIGAKDEADAKKLVQVGDTCIYDQPLQVQRERVTSPYLDDRLACAVLLCALERIERPSCDLYLVFTVQEEVGLRGAKTAAWQVEPEVGIAVDVTDVDDTPGSERCGTTRLGKGAAVKVMDSSIICHPEVVARLEELARREEIPFQRDIMRGGGTDAGAIHTTRLGVRTGGISIPCRYIHTPAETASLQDAAACVRLTVAFAQQ
ncbi:MAG: M42 family metallopeptidase, partial [Lawsonibacter sp.]|nr:M42 family metallopeptidase [Lawsonibacter sp.]